MDFCMLVGWQRWNHYQCVFGVKDVYIWPWKHHHLLLCPWHKKWLKLRIKYQFSVNDFTLLLNQKCKFSLLGTSRFQVQDDFRFEIDVDYGTEDYNKGVQYYLNLELLNHEDGIVQLQKIFQSYGPCNENQWIQTSFNQWIQYKIGCIFPLLQNIAMHTNK